MTQSFAPGLFGADTVRVCLVSYGNRARAFSLPATGINPVVASAGGGQSCAILPAADRVALGKMDGREPAQAIRSRVMSLSAFRGGRVTFASY